MWLEGYRTYEAVFLGTMFLAILATPVVINYAKKRGMVDAPGVRKVHAKAVARVGGIAIVFASMVLIAAVLFLDNRIGRMFRAQWRQILILLGGGMLMFLVGLVDDLRGVRARSKFLIQLLAATALCAAGARVGEVAVGSWGSIQTGEWGWVITILWIVGVTNAVNLIDGLDGLAAGICLIASGAVVVFAVYTAQHLLAVVMLALLGSLAGFLFLNFNPARVFMGDCGSLFLGFIIAGSSVMCVARSHSLKGIALPALALGVPIFDTLFSMLRRTIQRRSLFAPDQGHIHHRLLALGFEHHQVALLIYIITVISASLGLVMILTKGLATAAVFAGVCLLLILVFRVAGAVRLRETLSGVRRNRAIAMEIRRQREHYEHVELRLREATTFDQWWSGICAAAGDLEFVRVRMDLTRRDGAEWNLDWQAEGEPIGPGESVSVSVPIRDRREGGPLRAEVEVAIGGSVESAGRRIGFFGRLIDNYCPANLTRPLRTDASDQDEPAEGEEV